MSSESLTQFYHLSGRMKALASQGGNQDLAQEMQEFLDKYRAEQYLPRSNAELLQAQMLCRRLLIHSRDYDLIYQWYPSFKNPYGENVEKSLRNYVDSVQTTANYAYAWMKGYECVLECGCGAAALGLELAKYNKRWIASDVVRPAALERLTDLFSPGSGFEFAIVDGITLQQIPDGSTDIVLSRSFFEHLLLDDAVTHISSAFRVLKSGGYLVIACPAGVGPPSDITNRFPQYETPQGLHIKEYRVHELTQMLHTAGFTHIRSRFLRVRAVARLPLSLQRLNVLPPVAANLFEMMAQSTWKVVRAYNPLRQIWGNVWGHMGATSLNIIARKF